MAEEKLGQPREGHVEEERPQRRAIVQGSGRPLVLPPGASRPGGRGFVICCLAGLSGPLSPPRTCLRASLPFPLPVKPFSSKTTPQFPHFFGWCRLSSHLWRRHNSMHISSSTLDTDLVIFAVISCLYYTDGLCRWTTCLVMSIP